LLAGSGTFVNVGSIGGILTAAHVVHGFGSDKAIGLVRFNYKRREKLAIEFDRRDCVTIGAHPFGSTGPDLAFWRLSPAVVRSLEATNVFLNLLKRRNAGISGIPSPTELGSTQLLAVSASE